jgi:hypothetical protein
MCNYLKKVFYATIPEKKQNAFVKHVTTPINPDAFDLFIIFPR